MNEQPLLSAREALSHVVAFTPSLLAGLLVLVVGALVGWLCARIVIRLFVLLRIHRIIERLHWGEAFQKGDVRHTVVSIFGGTIGGLIFLIFLDKTLTLWELTVLSQLLERLVFLVPNLIVASLIFVVGGIVAAAVERSVRRTLYQEDVSRARLISGMVRAAILVFATGMALVQLHVASELVRLGFGIALGALGVAFALAMGLGSRAAVERMWEDVLRERRTTTKRENDSPEDV